MADRSRMTDEELGALVAAEISDAIDYDTSDFQKDRTRALEYYRGEMKDLEPEEGRSSITSHDVQDTIGALLPSLMRVFFSSDRIGVFEPEQRGDEDGAEQATDYANYIILRECDGYTVFWDVFHDALLHANGVVKHWWDRTPKVTTERFSGLSDDQAAELLSDENVEVLEHSETIEVEPVEDEETGEIVEQEIRLHDLKIKRTDPGGRLTIASVPPEEFLINRQATCVEDARLVAHRTRKTRSELLEMGYDREDVDSLPGFGSFDFDEVTTTRLGSASSTMLQGGLDKSTDEIEIIECYLDIDHDGDGIAERLRIVVGGDGYSKILDWEVWEDEVPFTDFVAERVPHRYRGRSVFEDTEDIQRVKTVLKRGMLDNLYQTNVPDRAINIERVKNPEALNDRRLGNNIYTDGDPASIIRDMTIPFVAKDALTGLEYMDQVKESRTGVSRASMALDLEALQNQSATAVNAAQAASYSKTELIARNFAEMGFKRFFKCVLKLIVQHQDRARTIRLRDEWVDMDPRGWNANMDCTISVGLGSGSRDRDVAYLDAIGQRQMGVLEMFGPTSAYGMKMLGAMHHTMSKMVEMTGLKNPEDYFPELTEEDMQALAEAAQQDPEAAKAQAQMEADQQKAMMQMQLEQQKAQMQVQLEDRKMQAQALAKQSEIETNAALKREQVASEMALKREQLAAELGLKREQLIAELQLKRELGLANAEAKAESTGTSPVKPGGEPG